MSPPPPVPRSQVPPEGTPLSDAEISAINADTSAAHEAPKVMAYVAPGETTPQPRMIQVRGQRNGPNLVLGQDATGAFSIKLPGQVTGEIKVPEPGSENERRYKATLALNEHRRLVGHSQIDPYADTTTRSLAPEEREWLSAYSAITPEKEMIVNGKKTQVQLVNGGPGIESGFVNAQTGEYLQGKIENPRTSVPVERVKDMKGEFVPKGQEYFAELDPNGEAKPLKIGKTVLQPQDNSAASQMNAMQRSLNGQIAQEYRQFATRKDQIDRGLAADLLRVEDMKSNRADPSGQPIPLDPAERAKLKNQLVSTAEQKKQELQQETTDTIQAISGMYGVRSLVPFMQPDELKNLGLGANGTPIPVNQYGANQQWTYPGTK